MAMQLTPGIFPALPTNPLNPTSQARDRQLVDAADAGMEKTLAASSTESPGEHSAPSTLAKQPSREQIDQAMKEVKQALPFQARDLQFSIDNDTGRTVIKIVDPATKEVIRQMPSEELLAITKSLDKFTGLLTKQKV